MKEILISAGKDKSFSLPISPKSEAQLDLLIALLKDMLPEGFKLRVKEGKTKILSDKNHGVTWSNQDRSRILCPKHGIYGTPKIKEVKGRKYLYVHHWLRKRAVDCYLRPLEEDER